MKEKLQEYALIAEITGGIAIVISLAFVTLELQESNLQARANAAIQISELISDWSFNLGNEPEASKVFLDGLNDFNALSDKEKSQFQYLIVSFYSALSGAITARNLILRDGDTSLIEGGNGNLQNLILNIVGKPGFKQWWNSEYKINPPVGFESAIIYYMDLEKPTQ